MIAAASLIPITILALLIYRQRFLLATFDWRLQWDALLFAFIVYNIVQLLAASVWASLMHSLGSQVALGTHIGYYCLAQLAKRLPGTVWYVAGRSYLYKQHGDSARLVAVASGIELLITILSGALVSIAFAGYWLMKAPAYFVWGLVVIAVASSALLLPAPRRWLWQWGGLREIPTFHYMQWLRWLMAYLLIWLLGGVIFFLTMRTVTPIAVGHLPFLMGSWALIGTLSHFVFLLPSNLGITEVGFSLLLVNIVPSSVAVLIAVLSRVVLMTFELIDAILLTLIGYRITPKNGQKEPIP